MRELSVPVGVVLAFFQLPVALQTVVLLMQQLGHPHVAYPMPVVAQFGRKGARAFADPAQRRFRIATGGASDQLVQRARQSGVHCPEVFTSSPRATDALGR